MKINLYCSMNVRKLLISTCVILLPALQLVAQHKPFTFGLNGGFNLSNAHETVNYIIGEKKSKPGFQVGFNADYNLSNAVYIRSGVSLTTKGTIHEDAERWIGGSNAPITYRKIITNQTYLQLPLLIGYKFSLTSSTRLFIQAGAYIAYGIGGKEVTRNKTVHSSGETNYEKTSTDTFGETRTGLAKTDFGLSSGVGIEYKRFALGVNYEPGLINIGEIKEADTYSKRDYKNRNLSVTVGYRL
ncbi:UNVERIFIED_ORG: outer membrane protein with beta-barrel domain [Chitinophaga ginsengisegetis]